MDGWIALDHSARLAAKRETAPELVRTVTLEIDGAVESLLDRRRSAIRRDRAGRLAQLVAEASSHESLACGLRCHAIVRVRHALSVGSRRSILDCDAAFVR
jgi:hypothetical protein